MEHLLVTYSASPEQYKDDTYTEYHVTKGCAFDQQLIWENHNDTLKAAAILNIEDDLTNIIKSSIFIFFILLFIDDWSK